MMAATHTDPRIVLTLDAGGSSFRFFATQGGKTILDCPPAPSHADNLDRCIESLVEGFSQIRGRCPVPPVAISFAFPGPADYPAGIIRDLPNLPAFRGGVPLGPLLQARLGLPVFINNDGDLFAYGEATAGFLPAINEQLGQAGIAKRYRNLLGVTFGTGFGGGLVHNGALVTGDNSTGGEIWLTRNKLDPDRPAEDGVSIRAVRRVYAELTGIRAEDAPDPKTINEIAHGRAAGNQSAAIEAFRRLGEVAGDAIAQALTLFDGIVVIGGGLAKAGDLFLPPLVAAMNASFQGRTGPLRRLIPHALNFEDPVERQRFLHREVIEVAVPGTAQRAVCDKVPLTTVGLSRLGTSEAITLGAYVFALRALDAQALPASGRS